MHVRTTGCDKVINYQHSVTGLYSVARNREHLQEQQSAQFLLLFSAAHLAGVLSLVATFNHWSRKFTWPTVVSQQAQQRLVPCLRSIKNGIISLCAISGPKMKPRASRPQTEVKFIPSYLVMCTIRGQCGQKLRLPITSAQRCLSLV